MQLAQSCKFYLFFELYLLLFVYSLGRINFAFAKTEMQSNVPSKTILEENKLGSIAPKCELRDLNGKVVQFPKDGKVNLIMYWSLFCHKCIDEMPIIIKEIQNNKNLENLEAYFITLDTEKFKIAVENFIKKRNLSCTVLFEEIASDSYVSADLWGVVTTPSVFVVGTDSRIVFHREGIFSIDELISVIKKHLE